MTVQVEEKFDLHRFIYSEKGGKYYAGTVRSPPGRN